MADKNDIPLPSVPDGKGVKAYISAPDADKVVPDLWELLTGPDEISPKSLALSPATIPASVAGYAVAGDKGTGEVEAEVRSWARELDAGKISKYDAYYLPETPLPYGVWEYRCSTCRFYHDAAEGSGEAGHCEVVGQEGDIGGGESIHPSAWCALWLPEEGRGWFEFVTDRLEGQDGTR